MGWQMLCQPESMFVVLKLMTNQEAGEDIRQHRVWCFDLQRWNTGIKVEDTSHSITFSLTWSQALSKVPEVGGGLSFGHVDSTTKLVCPFVSLRYEYSLYLNVHVFMCLLTYACMYRLLSKFGIRPTFFGERVNCSPRPQRLIKTRFIDMEWIKRRADFGGIWTQHVRTNEMLLSIFHGMLTILPVHRLCSLMCVCVYNLNVYICV